MARPRLSDGYTRVHNELIERALCRVNFSSYEWRVMWAVIRMSWGWNRPGCYSSYREIASRTGIDLRSVAKTVKALEFRFILSTRKGRNRTYFGVNTDYMTWRVPEKDSLFSPPKVTDKVEAPDCEGVGDSTNAPSNTALAIQPTPGVGDSTNTPSPESPAHAYFAARLKKLLKKSFKETEGGE